MHAEALAEVIALAESADERALLIQAEPGMGKSRLLENAAERASTPVRHVRARPGELGFALAGVSAVVDALRGPGGHGDQPITLTSRDPDAMFAGAQDLLSLVRSLDLPPTLLLVDDADRMDVESRVLLGFMAGRLAGTGVRIVATVTRLYPEGPLSGMSTIRLRPLSLEQTIALARQYAPAADPSTLRVVAGYSGGNPSILHEQLQQIAPDELDGSAWLTLPPRPTDSLEKVASSTLDALLPVTREVLETASLAVASHWAALGAEHPEAPDAIEDLIAASVLQRRGELVEIIDPRMRSTVHWSMRSQARRKRHAEMAQRSAGYDDRLAAWHRSFDGVGPDTVSELLRSAIWLVREGRTWEAVEYAERALGWTLRLDEQDELLIELCSELLRQGEVTLATRYSSRLRPDAANGRAMELATVRLTAHVMATGTMEDEEVLTLIRLHSETDEDAAGRLLAMAMFFRSERWEIDEARTLHERCEWLLPDLSLAVRETLRAVGEVLDALEGRPIADERAHAVDVETTPPDVLLLRGRALTWSERHAEARSIFTIALNHPDRLDPVWTEIATYAQITNEIGAGEHRRARLAIQAWEDTSSWITDPSATTTYIRAWRTFSEGGLDEAKTLITSCIEQATDEAGRGIHARALALRGRVELVDEDLEAAVGTFRELTAVATRFRNPLLLRHLADYVEVCVRTGRLAEAAAALEGLERRHRATPSRWAELALLRCRALMQRGSAAIDLFAAAVDAFGRDESPYELGRTLASLADRQDDLGLDSRRTRLSAATAFERAGADAWVAQVTRTSQTSEPSTSMLDRLTEDERAVASKVLLGQRTREIADALHLSVRTVELRLTRIYRTFDVRSRIELVALLEQ